MRQSFFGLTATTPGRYFIHSFLSATTFTPPISKNVASASKQIQLRCASGGGRGPPEYHRPYSGSLPSPGHEWCSRCNIPSRKFQVAIGERHPCLDLPTATFRFLGLHLCAPARQYYRDQLTTMAFLVAVCFVVLPAGTSIGFPDADDDDVDDGRH